MLELKQELQVRQKSIHETPDNEKEKEKEKSIGENEKTDPTKSPVTFGSNKTPSSTPIKSNF